MDYPFHPSGLGLRDDRHTGKQTARPALQTTLPALPRPAPKKSSKLKGTRRVKVKYDPFLAITQFKL